MSDIAIVLMDAVVFDDPVPPTTSVCSHALSGVQTSPCLENRTTGLCMSMLMVGLFVGDILRASTRQENVQRVNHHLVSKFGDRELASLRDELQDFLDQKSQGLSFSVADHLRGDLPAIFQMAVSEGVIVRNPALLLFTPKQAKKPVRRAMTIDEVQKCFAVLGERERLIAKLAVLAGMRPGEIFALTWGQLGATYAGIRPRVYRGLVDTPKTDQSFRKAALSEGLIANVERWRLKAFMTEPEAWVFV
jgi:integrase